MRLKKVVLFETIVNSSKKNIFVSRTDFVSYFFVIVIVTVTVIVLYTMFILELWTELEDKHC